MTPTTVTVSHSEDGHIEICFGGDGFDLTFALTQDRAARTAAWLSDEIAQAPYGHGRHSRIAGEERTMARTLTRMLICSECAETFRDDAPGLSRHLFSEHAYDPSDAAATAQDALTNARIGNGGVPARFMREDAEDWFRS